MLIFTVPMNVAATPATAITKTDISFRGDGGLILHGIITAPAAVGHYPGLVMIGGSGPWTTAGFASDADAFAERGIAVLTYNKRTVGYSAIHRDYSVLANDAIGAVSFLRSRPNVNSSLVGVYGLSEGGWVAPLAATRTTAIAYVITVGASGVSPSRQQSWQYSEWLHHAGVSGSLIQMMRTSIRLGVGLGLYPEANYDSVSVWRRVHQPVLALWGTLDRHAVPAESSHIIAQALQQGGNSHYTVKLLSNASHDLHITHDNGFDDLNTLAPAYPATLTTWVNNLSRSLPQTSIDVAQPEDIPSTPVTPLTWYESRWSQAVVFAYMLLVFSSYPIVALIRRLRHRPSNTPLRQSMRLLATLGFVSVVGFFVYFAFLSATNASRIGPVILGNPIPWLLLRGLSLATTLTVVWTGIEWYSYHKDTTSGRVQLGFLLAAGGIFIAWASYWSMLFT